MSLPPASKEGAVGGGGEEKSLLLFEGRLLFVVVLAVVLVVVFVEPGVDRDADGLKGVDSRVDVVRVRVRSGVE